MYYYCKNAEQDMFTSFMTGKTYDNKIECSYTNIELSEQSEQEMTRNLSALYNRWEFYYNLEDKTEMYYKFKIPKSSGGFRDITAPKDGPAVMFTDIQRYLENGFMNTEHIALAHDNAYAYIKTRWCKPAVKKHQDNNSEYFAHLDLHDFFGSTTKSFAMRMLGHVYPFGPYMMKKENKELLEKVLDICFLNDGLPQGTQVSPMLSNIIMIPFDWKMDHWIKSMENTLVYTRYADDMIVSCAEDFSVDILTEKIGMILEELNAPYRLNDAKTSYHRNKGHTNFILGIQLNQDNNMTIGRKRKREIRWMLHSYFNHKENWSTEDLQSLAGTLNYFNCIEPEVYKLTMDYYNRKYDCNVVEEIYEAIAG